jgi:putative hydrolase of the HAD superfamily
VTLSPPTPPGRFAAVIFDIGGVVTDSPLQAIARYEADHGLPPSSVNRAVAAAGEAGAWSRLERGEITIADFLAPFEADCRAHGIEVKGERVMAYIATAGRPRPRMLAAIRALRSRGFRVAALTNNWIRERRESHPLREHFECIVESSVVGLRKPDPRIYALACRELGVEPRQAVFLDDIGRNLKAARTLGMATIKVDEPDQALRELEALLGVPLLS